MSLTVSASASRLSGVAPLGVCFHATATTSTTTTKPFRDLDYKWRFGDSGSGTWSGGARPGSSKNIAYDPVTGHVFETPGTFTVTLTVHDGEDTQEDTFEITVTDPDVVFSGTNTVCVSTAGTFTGKPTGAEEVTSSDFDSVIATYVVTGKRVLFRRGETFTSSAAGSIAAAGAISVGAFGTGDRPIVSGTNIAGIVNISNTAVNDLRVMDLDIRGNGATDTGIGFRVGSVAVDNITLLRCSITEIGQGMSVASGGGVVQGSVFQENTINNYYASGGNAFFGRTADTVFLGNEFGPVPAAGSGEHVLRIQRGQRTAVNHNTLTTANALKHVVTLRGDEHVTDEDDSYYVVISDNKIIGDLEDWLIHIRPSSDTEDQRQRDVILERNWIVMGENTPDRVIITSGQGVTIRNNVFNLAAGAGVEMVEVAYTNTGGAPVPDDTVIVNNSAFSSAASGTTVGVLIDTEATNTTVYNNVVYAPNADAGDMINGTGASGLDAGNNSSDAQITDTAPFTDTTPTDPNAGDFTPTGYALTDADSTVKAWRDFFGNFRGSAKAMGAAEVGTEDDPVAESSDGLVEQGAAGSGSVTPQRKRRYIMPDGTVVQATTDEAYEILQRFAVPSAEPKTKTAMAEKKIAMPRIELERRDVRFLPAEDAEVDTWKVVLGERFSYRPDPTANLLALKRLNRIKDDEEAMALLI